MISKFTTTLGLALLAIAAPLKAQHIEDFSHFESPNTLFFGDWSITGDPMTGSLSPVPSFAQSSGSYLFGSGSNQDISYVERSFSTPGSFAGSDRLELSMRLLPDNLAESLTITLYDSSASSNSVSAVFFTSDFVGNDFTSVSALLPFSASFDLSAVTRFRISGNDPFGGSLLSMEMDQLSASSSQPGPTPVPEPSTYGFCGTGLLLGLGALRRRNRYRCSAS